MTLGEKLKHARLEAGLSQRQLCGDVITRNMLSQIENGSARPSMDTLSYLAARLGKTVSYFLEEQAVVSPNLTVMEQARERYQSGDYAGCVNALEAYQGPDGVCDSECDLLLSLSALAMAEQAIRDDRLPYARALLEQVRASGIYYPALQRQHNLLLARAGQDVKLPDLDEELLLCARDALARGQFDRCNDLLQAVQNKESAQWALLKGEVCFQKQAYRQAADYYRKAEEIYPQEVYPKLEACYRELGEYKLAYEYACKQR